jgi:hypothetical protein
MTIFKINPAFLYIVSNHKWELHTLLVTDFMHLYNPQGKYLCYSLDKSLGGHETVLNAPPFLSCLVHSIVTIRTNIYLLFYGF